MEVSAIIMGQRVRAAKQAKKAKTEELAEKVNIAVESICHIECGARKPSLTLLFNITEVLEVSLDCLTGRTPTTNDGRGEGEVKIKHHLHSIFTPMISYEFPLREAAVIFGTDYDVALNTLNEMKETQKMDNELFHTYKDIFFIPMDVTKPPLYR